jgi:F-type H+-transporting ATPase subunit delta
VADEAHKVGLAGRYASAVFDLAREQNAMDAVSADFSSLGTAIASSKDLARFVKAPVFTSEMQKKGMDALLVKIGASPLTKNFVSLLASKRRLSALADIIRSFEALVAAQKGEVQASVTSARALSDAETNQLKAALKASLGREPRLESKVDPSLLGGLVVKVGSRMIDSSLRTKLNGIRTAMRG